ncbi:MAG: hypothetical protein RLN62_04420 [Rickettsiales bacterium]
MAKEREDKTGPSYLLRYVAVDASMGDFKEDNKWIPSLEKVLEKDPDFLNSYFEDDIGITNLPITEAAKIYYRAREKPEIREEIKESITNLIRFGARIDAPTNHIKDGGAMTVLELCEEICGPEDKLEFVGFLLDTQDAYDRGELKMKSRGETPELDSPRESLDDFGAVKEEITMKAPSKFKESRDAAREIARPARNKIKEMQAPMKTSQMSGDGKSRTSVVRRPKARGGRI